MSAKDAVLITPYRDGPLLIRGPFELLDNKGAPLDTQRDPVALCRCGKSRIRPFCDGTHKLIGFQAPPAADA
jgi:CDGSH-type Zn-finger protein